MNRKMYLGLFIILLELSLLKAQNLLGRPGFRGPRPFRPPMFNGRQPRFPFFRRPGPRQPFMPFGRRPINPQNGFVPFNNPLAMDPRFNRFPNQIPNQIPNGFPNANQQVDASNAPPAVVTGTIDPRSITGVSSRFALPSGRELIWQMSSPPAEEGTTFGNGAAGNALPGTQNRFNAGANIQQNNLINGNNQVIPNRLNPNVVNQIIPNGLNSNAFAPQSVAQQGFQRPPLQTFNGQNQFIRPTGQPQSALVQEPVPIINAPGILGGTGNQMLANQQLPSPSALPTNSQQMQANTQFGGRFRSIPDLPAMPSFTSGAQPDINPGGQQTSNLVADASMGQGSDGRVPIWPAVPGMADVPVNAVQSNGSFDFVEVITISDAEGNIYYQGLNSTDADNRQIERILTEIQKNQTAEAHRRGRAGLATLPDSTSGAGVSGTGSGSQSSFASAGGADSTSDGGSSGPQNITVMDEFNNILYQGPELSEAELQAHIKSVLEAQERQKLLAQDNNQNVDPSQSSGSGTQPEITPSISPSNLPSNNINTMSRDRSVDKTSRDQNRLDRFSGPVGFDPIANSPFNRGGFEPVRNIPSQFPPQFNPTEERFAQRQRDRVSSDSVNIGRNSVRSGIPDSSISNTDSRTDPRWDNSPNNNRNSRNDFQMSSDIRMPLQSDSSRSSSSRGPMNGRGRRFILRTERSEDHTAPGITLSRTVWTI